MRRAVTDPTAIVRESLLSAPLMGAASVDRIEVARVELARVELAPSHEEPATFVACYLLPAGETRLIEML